MIKITGIYKVTSPSDNIYIGQSRNIFNRWDQYERYKAKTQVGLGRSFSKYGVTKHVFEIVHELPNDVEDDVLNEYERLYWNAYKEGGAVTLNAREPGNGKLFTSTKNILKEYRKRQFFSPESIKKGAEKRRGVKRSKEVIEKGQATRRSYSDEHKKQVGDKIRKSKLGKKPKESTVLLWKQQRKGKIVPRWQIELINNCCRRPVIQYTLDGVEIKEYSSISEANKAIGKKSVGMCVTGRMNTCGGFLWKYK